MMQKYEEETLRLNWVNKSIFTKEKCMYEKLVWNYVALWVRSFKVQLGLKCLKRQQVHTLFTEHLQLQFHKIAMFSKMLLWNAWLKRAVNHSSIPSAAVYHIYKSNLGLVITGVWDNNSVRAVKGACSWQLIPYIFHNTKMKIKVLN